MIRPVILSGGGGTRLWPVSTSSKPKQFQKLLGGSSLLQATAARCRGEQFHAPLILTAEEQVELVTDQLMEIGVTPDGILLEPVARNTAPAIAAAAFWSLSRGEDDPMLIMPSDHVIGDSTALHDAANAALPFALEGKLLTFGIKPTGPKTGYGYIHAPIEGQGAAREVERFVEKPNAEVAAGFVHDGGYFWNSGIFLFRPSAYLRELRRHAPAIAEHVESSMANASADLLVRPDSDAFASAPNISIDYAVMEPSAEVLVVPVGFDWSDVGSWDALHDILPGDADGNVMTGEVVALDVKKSLIRNDSGLTLAVVGLEGVACIVTSDAIFLAPLDRAQDAKLVVEELRRREDPAQS